MKKNILVHYYPGMNAAPMPQFSRYTGSKNILIEETGEIVKNNKTGLDLFNPDEIHITAPKMKEIKIAPDHSGNAISRFFSEVSYWFASIPSIISHWKEEITIQKTKDSNNTGSYQRFEIDRRLASLGQETDINDFREHNEILDNLHSDKQRIYFGVSRGAATTFSALADIKPKNAALCILEAPPSSLSGLFKEQAQKYTGSRGFGKWFYQHFASLFLGKQHKTDKASQARGHVDEFPNDIPLMIVSSKGDNLVMHENTIRLAARVADKRRKAQEAGENVAPVYFLQLDAVDHNEYATSNHNDSIRYRNAVHALFKKHEIDCFNEDYAVSGETDLELSNLLDGRYSSYLDLQRKFWDDKSPESRRNHRDLASEELKKNNDERVASIVNKLPLLNKDLPNVETVRSIASLS